MAEYETIRDGLRFHVVSHKGGGKGGSGGGNTSTHTAVEAPNTLRSKATARILEIISEGPIEGLALPGLQGVYLDKTPIENPDGTRNFTVDQFDFRHGEPDQDVVPGFAAGEAEVSVGIEMQPTVPIVRRLSPGIDAIRVKVRVNALYYQTKTGDIQGTGVSASLEWNIGNSGWVPVADISISGKTMSAYERALRVQLPKTSQTIDIRLTKHEVPTSAEYANALYFSAYTEIVDGALIYPDTALAAMVIDAQYFPNIPTRGYLVKGVRCQIPSNYDPVARTYAGDWDGTFKTAWTNNPAWVLYDAMSNARYGSGQDIVASLVDKWGLYECSRYNDEQVPDGKGGYETRFLCNVVVNTREDAYKVLNAIASNMRALLYAANDTIFVVQDRPIVEWTRTFSPANVTDGMFDYTGTDVRSRFNAATVIWNDPSQNFEPAAQYVPDPELISTQPYRATEANAYATTAQGQSIRHGRWLIVTGQEEDEVVSFKTSLENADVRPGQGILLQDPSRAGARLGGRTLTPPAGANLLALDAPAPGILPGWKVWLTIDKTVVDTTVVKVISEDLIEVSGLPANEPVPAASLWLAHDITVEPTPWRVATIKEAAINSYEILATKYSPGKFAYIDNGVKIPPPDYSTIPTGPLGNATDIRLREYIYRDPSGQPQFGIVLSWLPSVDSRVSYYTVEMEGPAGDFRRMANQVGTSVDVPLMRAGTWKVFLIATDNLGRRSLPLVHEFNTIGLTAKPQPPHALYGSVNGSWLDLEWLPTDEIDVQYYWIQYSPLTDGSATWLQSTSVTTRIGYNTTRVTVPARVGTYFIKTIDSLGQESQAAASIIIYREVRPPNLIVVLKEDPTWTGTKNLWTKVGNYLELPPPAAPEVVPPDVYPGTRGLSVHGQPTRYSFYYFANSLDQGAVGNVLLQAKTLAFGSYGDNSMSTWQPLAAAQPLAMGASNAFDVALEIRGSPDGVTWGPWRPTTATSVDVRRIQVRMVGMLYDLLTTLRVSLAECRVDVPDRQLGANNVPFDGVGRSTVVYSTGFYAVPNIQFTGFAAGNQGTNIVIISSDKHGFTCEQRRDNGNPVGGGSYNWLAVGFGVS